MYFGKGKCCKIGWIGDREWQRRRSSQAEASRRNGLRTTQRRRKSSDVSAWVRASSGTSSRLGTATAERSWMAISLVLAAINDRGRLLKSVPESDAITCLNDEQAAFGV